ncbi:MAG: hypothetical protein HYT41_02630 [Candidatus Sungbacteria bacterium]|nr:hypothetical protein [Candidatus Sungbacteria bacterium]
MTLLAKPEALAEIARDIGQVFFASLIVSPLVANALEIRLTIFGLTLSSIFWLTSLFLSKA